MGRSVAGHAGAPGEELRQLGLFLGGGERLRDGAGLKGAPFTDHVARDVAGDVAGEGRARSFGVSEKDTFARHRGEERRVWGVVELVSRVRQDLERVYGDMWVQGEVSNCRLAGSGHVYFTLKDGDAQLSVVLFRRQALLLRFAVADGLAVVVRGRVSVFEGRGQLQLIAETMEPRGAGALQVAFEQMKAKLRSEGLFDQELKRTLPAFPKCVGVVTSIQGAVLRDIVTVCQRRHSCLHLLVYPAAMQGAACAEEVGSGVRWFNAHREQVDLILLARGGGSIEDLAGFNDEALAREIARSELPILSAIGHETDFTIADLVADLRAPTPSAAAEMITAAQHDVDERVESLEARVRRAGRYHLLLARQRYAQLAAQSVLLRVRHRVERRAQRVDELQLRLQAAAERGLRRPEQALRAAAQRLKRQDVGERLARVRRRMEVVGDILERMPAGLLAARRARLEQTAGRLAALSPLAVLGRGYALLYCDDLGSEGSGADGELLRSVQGTAPGRRIRARLHDGYVAAEVTTIASMEEGKG